MVTDAQMAQYHDEGYFIADDLVAPDMFAELREAAERVVERVRSGEVDVHTGRTKGGEPWSIGGLLAPAVGEPIFAEYLTSGPMMDMVHAFLGPELQMGFMLLFSSPRESDYGFGWHRDFGTKPRDGTEEVELAILDAPIFRVKWHMALIDDACLMLVPGSNRRYRTEHELKVLLETKHDDIPGQKVMDLKAGQTIVWHGYTMHRGIMTKDVRRLSLAAGFFQYRENGPVDCKEIETKHHWMLAEDVKPNLPEVLHVPYDRWRRLQEVEALTAD